MDEIKDRTGIQLQLIEQSYSIKIRNKEDVARVIAEGAIDKRQVLTICTSLNYWVAANKVKGDVVIPLEVVLIMLERL